MAKKIKTEVEKQCIIRLWNQRKRYLSAKEDFDNYCCWEDGVRMRKAKREMGKIRAELYKERNKSLYKNAA